MESSSLSDSLIKKEKFLYVVEVGRRCSSEFEDKMNRLLDEGWEPITESRIVMYTEDNLHESIFLKRWE